MVMMRRVAMAWAGRGVSVLDCAEEIHGSSCPLFPLSARSKLLRMSNLPSGRFAQREPSWSEVGYHNLTRIREHSLDFIKCAESVQWTVN
jgi:hypothetical protein